MPSIDNVFSGRLILCADDYALTTGVSAAIVRLLRAGRLSATGCMTVSPLWPRAAAELRPFADTADIGLHFTLTDLPLLGPMPTTTLGALMTRALLGRLDRATIADELARQLDAFAAAFGRPPAFIDGHKHVQQLPVVRDAILDACVRTGAWLRVCDEPLSRIAGRGVAPGKAAVVSLLGAGLRRAAAARGVTTNDSFAGVYDFSDEIPYSQLFERFVTGAHLVMCHPGEADEALQRVDPGTVGSRPRELAYFESDAFGALLAERGLALAPLRQARRAT